jgi:hypothetical protein
MKISTVLGAFLLHVDDFTNVVIGMEPTGH